MSSFLPYPEYKKVGLPWLDRVPSHWEIKRGKSIFRSVDIRSTTGDEELLTVSSRNGVIPRKDTMVTMFKAESYVGYKLCWPNDLVINSLWAWATGLGVSKHHGIVSSAYGVYRPKDTSKINPKFIDYFVRSIPFQWELQVRSKGVWTSRLQLTDEAFLDAPFIVPPLEEQNAIVRFLDYMDNLIKRYIRAKQKEIKLLNEKKLVIIHDLITQGMDPSVSKKESGIGWLPKIPEHWTVKPLKRWVSINKKSLSNLTKKDFTFDYYDIGTISTGYKVHQPVRMTFEQSPSRARRIVNNGDTIISTVRTYLKAVFFFETIHFPTIVSTGFAVLTPGYELLPEYLGYVIQEHVFIEQVTANSCGVDYPAINQTKLSNIKIAVPTKEEQIRIVDEIREKSRPIDDRINTLTQEIALINEFYKRLVSDVITGKIDVCEFVSKIDQTKTSVEIDELDPFLQFDEDPVVDEEGEIE